VFAAGLCTTSTTRWWACASSPAPPERAVPSLFHPIGRAALACRGHDLIDADVPAPGTPAVSATGWKLIEPTTATSSTSVAVRR
jgi:hypothetical protein